MSYSYLFPLICISSKGSHICTVTFAYNNRDSFFSVAIKSLNSNQQLSTATCNQRTHCATQRLTNPLGEKAGTTTVKEQPAMFVRASFSTFLRCGRSAGRSVCSNDDANPFYCSSKGNWQKPLESSTFGKCAWLYSKNCTFVLPVGTFGGAPTTMERPTKQRWLDTQHTPSSRVVSVPGVSVVLFSAKPHLELCFITIRAIFPQVWV